MPGKWFERAFDFTGSVTGFARLLERLRAAPDRAGRLLRAVPAEPAALRLDGTWSMLENVGHLADLEDLHVRRIAEIRAGAAVLCPADLANRQTEEAGHGTRGAGAVVADLYRERARLLEALAAVPPEDLELGAMHPRLKRPMRIADLAQFVAEHDDHHLARAAEIAARLRLDGLPWSEPSPGLRSRKAAHGELTLRRLLLAPGFDDPAVCKQSHDVYVLGGDLEVDLGAASGRVTIAAGQTATLVAPHRPLAPQGADLVLVEPAEG